jgi:5-hydroxyisourate hydrolase-like protein (transthyretin family)
MASAPFSFTVVWPNLSPFTSQKVLDSTLGKPADSVNVRLEVMEGSSFVTLASGYVQGTHFPPLCPEGTESSYSQTDSDGRCTNLLPPEPRLQTGLYKMVFNTGEYFEKDKRDTFYPVVEVCLTAECTVFGFTVLLTDYVSSREARRTLSYSAPT